MLKSIVKKFRRLIGRLREKAPIRMDDHEFEHLLLYHGLVGSSPDNQRAFKDVRADIRDAVRNASALQLGIALKLQPLHWQDKLATVFNEIAEERADLLRALLPDTEGEPWPNMGDPLGHDDWRVRANAAFAIATLGLSEGCERMIKALHDTASGDSPAFCHIAYALAKIPNDESKAALLQHLDDPEPWFRVDAAGALAQFPEASVKTSLMRAMLTINQLSDYLAVALVKHYSVTDLLNETDDEDVRNGGCQLLAGLADAANQTFTPEVLQDTDICDCATKLLDLSKAHRNVFSLIAILNLLKLWREKGDQLDISMDGPALTKLMNDLEADLQSAKSKSHIESILTSYAKKHVGSTKIELLDAIKLAGALKLTSTTNNLLELLKVVSPLREDIVAALGAIGDARAVTALIELANSLYKPEERSGPSLSSKTVEEDDNDKAKLYWRVLEAFGNLPSKLTVQFLFKAAADFAPDKRQQAVESLCNLFGSFTPEEKSQFAELVAETLEDPSTPVRVSALKGVAALNAVQHIDKVLKLSDSQEPSVSRQALTTLGRLSHSRDKAVISAIENKLAHESDPLRKKRLENVLNS